MGKILKRWGTLYAYMSESCGLQVLKVFGRTSSKLDRAIQTPLLKLSVPWVSNLNSIQHMNSLCFLDTIQNAVSVSSWLLNCLSQQFELCAVKLYAWQKVLLTISMSTVLQLSRFLKIFKNIFKWFLTQRLNWSEGGNHKTREIPAVSEILRPWGWYIQLVNEFKNYPEGWWHAGKI